MRDLNLAGEAWKQGVFVFFSIFSSSYSLEVMS